MRAPRFTGAPSSARASEIKKRTPRRDTSPELMLRRALWSLGLRYRTHAAQLPGRPDIIFSRQRLVVFCDGDFWHGRNWSARRERLLQGANAPYWIAKIQSNMRRDAETTMKLREAGWVVIRVWEGEIKSDCAAAARMIQDELRKRTKAITTTSKCLPT